MSKIPQALAKKKQDRSSERHDTGLLIHKAMHKITLSLLPVPTTDDPKQFNMIQDQKINHEIDHRLPHLRQYYLGDDHDTGFPINAHAIRY